MAEQTTKSISKKLHGSGVAHCGSYPEIWAKITITFERKNPSNPAEVTWSVTGNTKARSLPSSTSARFDYPFHAYYISCIHSHTSVVK